MPAYIPEILIHDCLFELLISINLAAIISAITQSLTHKVTKDYIWILIALENISEHQLSENGYWEGLYSNINCTRKLIGS